MEGGGAALVAGSHNRDELLVIHVHEEPKQARNSSIDRVCEICGDDVGLTVDGDLFVACNECGFPVCRPCYEYERREGSQLCPQCKTRYKRLKGSPRVLGDEDEEDVDDIEHEFSTGGPKGGDELPISQSRQDQRQPSSLHKRDQASAGGPRGEENKEESKKQTINDWKLSGGNLGFESGRDTLDPEMAMTDETRLPLSRKVHMAMGKINPYRMVVVARLLILLLFLRYRILNPVHDAIGLWATSVVCEFWFALSWILDQFPKWFPIDRQTYLDRLSIRYEPEGKPNLLPSVDVFVTAVDHMKEPPLVTANTILSVLAMDYPVDKFSCYISDDGASMLTFEAISATAEFARKWVPFCKKFSIEPRAPEMYFSEKIDCLKDKVQPTFVKERRSMKRDYEEFKVGINKLVAKLMRIPPDGWVMQDGTPWPGNNTKDHPGMIQVFLGNNGGVDREGNELPRLVYVSREKRLAFDHHKKAGAMNALVRVSAVLTNAPFVLNLDCDHYVNNSKAVKEAMCFLMDPHNGRSVCFVQFPQRFDGIDEHDLYANRNIVFFDINMKGLDGIQGPLYVGTGCVFRRQALYGCHPPKEPKRPRMVGCDCFPCFGTRKKLHKNSINGSEGKAASSLHLPEGNDKDEELMSQLNSDAKFGQSSIFATSTLMEQGGVPPSITSEALLKEAIHVISCDYEDKTEWGNEIGWTYGSITEDILTGFKMHCRGWRSIYCMPERPAFRGTAPSNMSDKLNQMLRWALGSMEIFYSRHCPIWYGHKEGKLKLLERFAYINTAVYPFTSVPILLYCTLPAICLLTDKFIMSQVSMLASFMLIGLFLSIFATAILELRLSEMSVEEWWRNEQFWLIGGVSAHLFAIVQGLLKVVAGIDTNFMVTSKATEDELGKLYTFKWTTLLIPPTTIVIINLVGMVAGITDAINSGSSSWGILFGKLFFSIWVIVHLYPFLKGLMGRQNRTPTIVVIWSVLLASIFSLLWVRIDPFVLRTKGPDVKQCGINC